MDPVTLTIVGALGSMAGTALTETAKQATGDAYQALKKIIQHKFGTTQAPALIETLERLPTADPTAQSARSQLAALNLNADTDVSQAAQKLAQVAQLYVNAGTHTQVTRHIEKFVGIENNEGTATFNVNL